MYERGLRLLLMENSDNSRVRLENNVSTLKLSIIVPVYNEVATIDTLLQKLATTAFPQQPEIIVVDDGSHDGTRELLKKYEQTYTVLLHEHNRGKGAAIRTGIGEVTGSHVVIQDADLEYDPDDLITMWNHMLDNDLVVLYGSRSLQRGRNKDAGFSFYWGGQLITLIANTLYFQRLTDEPTCYKMFKSDLLKALPLRCEGFEFCPEVTALVAKKGHKIPEIPITYYPRSATDGKKIKWRDGVTAIYTLIRYRLW